MALTKVTYDVLEDRFTATQTITTTSGTINLDASSYSSFRLTSDLTGATTLNIQNMRSNQVIDITVSGSQTITFSADDTTETFNKVGSTDYDGAADNHIQVVCLDDTDSAAIYNYTIGTYTSDTTP
jgi:viroplasmin and RNaseH domain-containing protein